MIMYRTVCLSHRRKECEELGDWLVAFFHAAQAAGMFHNLRCHDARRTGFKVETHDVALPIGVSEGTPLAIKPRRFKKEVSRVNARMQNQGM